jgi:hypothetical protein
MNTIQAVTLENFEQIAKNKQSLGISDFEVFFTKQINEASNYATGPYFWFIGNNNEMKIVAASKNINELTPYSHKVWSSASAFFFAENLHEEDRFYVLSAINLAVKKIEELPKKRQSDFRVNIYARMLDSRNDYRWVLIQMPKLHIDNKTQSNCAIIMVTDLSHLILIKNQF